MTLVDEVIDAMGGVKAVQERFNYRTDAGVYIWRVRGIPTKHHYEIHKETGIPMERLQAPQNSKN